MECFKRIACPVTVSQVLSVLLWGVWQLVADLLKVLFETLSHSYKQGQDNAYWWLCSPICVLMCAQVADNFFFLMWQKPKTTKITQMPVSAGIVASVVVPSNLGMLCSFLKNVNYFSWLWWFVAVVREGAEEVD